MNKKLMYEQMQETASSADPIGGTLKFVVDNQPIFIDGTGSGNIVSEEDKSADCVITISSENLAKLAAGTLNPMTAVMSGKVKVKGNMGMAMKLQSLIG